MIDIVQEEVYFDEYCKKCEHKDLKETLDPCNACLAQCWNEGSHKPVYYKEKS